MKSSWLLEDAKIKGKNIIYSIGVGDAIGLGIYLSVQALFLSRGVGLSNQQTGIVLGLSGIASLFGAIPIARGVQRIGLKRGLFFLLLARAAAFLALSFVNSFPFALIAISLTGATSRSTVPLIEAALIGNREREVSMRLLAHLRIFRTSGIAAGGIPVGIAVWLDTTEAYRALMVGSSVFFLLAALLCTNKNLTGSPPAQKSSSAIQVFSNLPFLKLTIVYGILTLATIIVGIGLPLWIVQHSDAPGWIVGAFKIINTLCVIIWQSHANKGTQVLSGALHRLSLGGVLVSIACALIALIGILGALGDTFLIFVVVIIFSFGEIYIAAGGQGAALYYTPDGQRPVYMAAFNLGFASATVIGPLLSSLSTICPLWIWLIWGGGLLLTTFCIRYIK